MKPNFQLIILPLEVQQVIDDVVRDAVEYGIALATYGGSSIQELEAYTVLCYSRKWLAEILEERVHHIRGEPMTGMRFC